MKDIVEIINDNQEFLRIYNNQKEEIERLNNIIYTTLEYVDREEINSIGTPYTYTERGKHIKELLEGERTFNSLWQENKRLNNIINELEKWLKECKNMCANYTFDDTYKCEYNFYQQIAIADFIKSFILKKLQELIGSDK